jgi:hypothetical protein
VLSSYRDLLTGTAHALTPRLGLGSRAYGGGR